MNIQNLLQGNVSINELLNYHDINVQYIDIPFKKIRGFVDYYRGLYVIYINKSLSYYKRKKTLLHELAHIELNHLCQDDKDLFAFKIEDYEDEADRYLDFIRGILWKRKIYHQK